MRARHLGVVGLLAAMLAGAAAAGEADDAIGGADRALVGRLEALAKWAGEAKLSRSKHRTWRTVLEFDGDHAEARAGLKFKRDPKTKAWVQAKDYKEPSDWNKDLVAEFEKRLGDALTAWRNDVLVVYEESASDLEPGCRSRVEARIRVMLPADDVAREAIGDERLGDRWVLADSAQAATRREEIRAWATEAHAAAKPLAEEVAGAAWPAAFQTPRVKVFGTVGPIEVKNAARVHEACGVFARKFFGQWLPFGSPSEIHIFGALEDAEAYFRKDPALGEEEWKKGQRVGSFWVPETEHLLVYGTDPEVRPKLIVRQCLNGWLGRRFGHGERGWVTEGVGLYLQSMLTGTRGGYFVTLEGTEGVDSADKETPKADEDWYARGREALAADGARKVRGVLTARLTAMDLEAVLVAHALAAWLFEARGSEEASKFIEATIESHDADAVLREVLETDAEALVTRLLSWLDERALLEAKPGAAGPEGGGEKEDGKDKKRVGSSKKKR